DFRASVRRIQRHSIAVIGSFIMGLDTDKRGIGKQIDEAANHYGVDLLNVLFLTPLPGTRLWDKMKAQGRIAVHSFPEDWKYFTLSFPVAQYKHLSWTGILQEMDVCDHGFYSLWHIGQRLWNSVWQRRAPLFLLVSNLSFRSNIRKNRDLYKKLDVLRGPALNE
ncbi:MAG: hypothetical protein KAV00_16515, partial [Phycisphaerae bacterium]|nr:hypothetical protein [Phycisphaerae bacterium]